MARAHYLWRAVDHEGEVLESYVTKRRDRKAALKFLRKAMKRYGGPEVSCDGQTTFLRRCNESCWQRGSAGNGSLGKQSGGEFPLAVSTTRTRYAPLPTDALSAESSLPSTLQSTTISIRNATSTHETISSSIEPLLLLSGANY